MLKEFFGVPKTPFKREKLQLLKHQQEIYETLLIYTRMGGFNIILGQPGVGKSVLKQKIEKLGEGINPECQVASITRTIHTYNMILNQIMNAINIDDEKTKAKSVEKTIIAKVFEINSMGKRLVTIIDEAHLLDLDVLRKIRLLFECFPNNHSLILFAQDELMGRLTKGAYDDLKTRIGWSTRLQTLSEEALKDYILKELQEAELPANTFEENAIDMICRSAQGNLRLCRNICYGALIEGVKHKEKIVDIQMVNRVLIQPHWRKNYELDLDSK